VVSIAATNAVAVTHPPKPWKNPLEIHCHIYLYSFQISGEQLAIADRTALPAEINITTVGIKCRLKLLIDAKTHEACSVQDSFSEISYRLDSDMIYQDMVDTIYEHCGAHRHPARLARHQEFLG